MAGNFLWRGLAAAGGLIVGGPVLSAVIWKGSGFVASGNPLHLIPGGSMVADGMSFAADIADTAGLYDTNIHGNPTDTNVHGNPPSDVHGNTVGRGIHGNDPNKPFNS